MSEFREYLNGAKLKIVGVSWNQFRIVLRTAQTQQFYFDSVIKK